MLRIILLISFIAVSCHCSEIISLTVLKKAAFIEVEKELKAIYLNAFREVYRSYWSVDFENDSLEFYSNYTNKFKTTFSRVLIMASINTVPVGWALFYKEEQRAIIELICVDSEHWQKGIGKKLIESLRDYYPEIIVISVVTQKINNVSPKFYKSLGFKKTNFSLPEYSIDRMQGYEWHIAS